MKIGTLERFRQCLGFRSDSKAGSYAGMTPVICTIVNG